MQELIPTTTEPDRQAPFERNRFLAMLAGGVFGFATQRILRAEPAMATHVDPDYPCFGPARCHYCSGQTCTEYCSWPHSAGNGHCAIGGANFTQCWSTCSGTYLYRCCDWHERFPGGTTHHCTCRGVIGRC